MPTYVMLTRLTPETGKSPADLKRLEKAVADHVRKDCPQVKWIANYATLGPYDYLDIFEAPDEASARAVMDGDPVIAGGFAPGELRPFRVSLLRGRDG